MLLPDFPSGYGNANFIQIIEFFLMLKPIFFFLLIVLFTLLKYRK